MTQPIRTMQQHQSQPTMTAPVQAPERGSAPSRNTQTVPVGEPEVSVSAFTAPVFDDEQRCRLRLDIAYDGTDFHGWARQKSLRTVQGTLEETLATVLRAPISLTVAGRTDAGVHASGQVAHCDINPELLNTRSIHGDPRTLIRRLARLLPADVRVLDCTFVSPLFDARFSALRRHYVYRVTTATHGALPTRARDTAQWRRPVQLSLLQEAADQVIGLHDFAAFCKARPFSTTIRNLESFEWVEVSTNSEPQTYEAHVTADAFCWSMVRSLVGACLAVGEGRREWDFMHSLLQVTQRSSRVPLAPAHGLTLVGVDYPEADEWGRRAEQTKDKRSHDDVAGLDS